MNCRGRSTSIRSIYRAWVSRLTALNTQGNFCSIAIAIPKAKVYLVGAGPGDPDLLTVRSVRTLGLADLVLHDASVSPQVLELRRFETSDLAAIFLTVVATPVKTLNKMVFEEARKRGILCNVVRDRCLPALASLTLENDVDERASPRKKSMTY